MRVKMKNSYMKKRTKDGSFTFLLKIIETQST